MELQQALRRRKMVRSFRQDPVPRDVIDAVMASVLHAPSAGFSQGNEFLVLSEPTAVDDFFELTENPEFPTPDTYRSVRPTVIVIALANSSAYTERYAAPDKIQFGLDDPANWPVPYWDVDAGMAVMLILLVVAEHGVGAFFAGVGNEPQVFARFGVPDHLRAIGFVGLGYPTEVDEESATSSAFKLRRRPLVEIVHHDSW